MIAAILEKSLDRFRLNAHIEDEGFLCLSGKNGSGKTTLMRMIAGIDKAMAGRVLLNSVDVTDLPVNARGVVMVTQRTCIPHLTVDQHLQWGAAANGRQVSIDQLNEAKAALGISFDGRVRNLSLGMRERVSLTTALLAEPKAILVDEAFSNLHDREQFISEYRRLLRAAHIDSVFSSQSDDDGDLADHHYVMRDGISLRLK